VSDNGGGEVFRCRLKVLSRAGGAVRTGGSKNRNPKDSVACNKDERQPDG